MTVQNSENNVYFLWPFFFQGAVEHIVFEITVFTQSEVSSVALEIQLTLAQWKCCESFAFCIDLIRAIGL